MAVDTRNKRAALISLGLWRGRVLPQADSEIDALDRLHLALLYPFGEIIVTFLPHFGVNANKTVGVQIAPE